MTRPRRAPTYKAVVSLKMMKRMTVGELYWLFSDSPCGDFPDGLTDGTVLWHTKPRSATIAKLVRSSIWHGKIFHADLRRVYKRFNRTTVEAYGPRYVPLGFDATIAIQPSIHDLADCIALNYTKEPALRLREELRQVAPNLWLGIAYHRRRAIEHFALASHLPDLRNTKEHDGSHA